MFGNDTGAIFDEDSSFRGIGVGKKGFGFRKGVLIVRDHNGNETPYFAVKDGTPVNAAAAYAELEITVIPSVGDYVEIAGIRKYFGTGTGEIDLTGLVTFDNVSTSIVSHYSDNPDVLVSDASTAIIGVSARIAGKNGNDFSIFVSRNGSAQLTGGVDATEGSIMIGSGVMFVKNQTEGIWYSVNTIEVGS